MLTKEEQIAAYIKVGELCRGTKFEGKEYLCVKFKQSGFDTEYRQYTDDSIDFDVKRDRIFAVAIVDDTPIWLEEPFKLYTKYTKEHCWSGYEFTYDTISGSIVGRKDEDLAGLIKIYLDFIQWKNFTLTRPDETCTNFFVQEANSKKVLKAESESADSKQVGGTHYKSKAIQPWVYMEANFTKEEFVGYLRGNAHKYLDRYKDKNGIEDLKKAIHYIEKLIEAESR